MKLNTIFRSIIGAFTLAVPALASAAVNIGVGAQGSGWAFNISLGSGGCASSLCMIGNTIISLINGVLVPLLFAISFIVFLYGIAKAYIFSAGDPGERKKGHDLLLWGLIGFVVMVSLWGLVNVASNTFGLGGYAAPMLPTTPVTP